MKSKFSEQIDVENDQGSGSLRVSVVQNITEMKKYADIWDALAEKSGTIHTASAAWLIPYMELLLDSDETGRCLFICDGGDLRAVLPLIDSARRQPWGRVVREVHTPLHPHAFSVDLVSRLDLRSFEIERLATTLKSSFPSWFHFKGCRLPRHSALLQRRRQSYSTCLNLNTFCDYGAYVDTRGSFDTYMSTLNRRFDRNLSRQIRKLTSLPDVQYVFLRGTEARPELLEQFLRIEASGWKGEKGTAIANNSRLVAFYREAVANLFRRHWLEWHLLRADGRTIAMQMGVRMNHHLYLWKIAFDEDYGFVGPGSLLLRETLRRSFLDPYVDRVNCITDMRWNRNWRMTREEYRTLHLWPKRIAPAVFGYLPTVCRESVKRVPVLKHICQCLRETVSRSGHTR